MQILSVSFAEVACIRRAGRDFRSHPRDPKGVGILRFGGSLLVLFHRSTKNKDINKYKG